MTKTMIAKKQCPMCRVFKPMSEFSKRSDSPDRLAYKCRTCKNKASKECYSRSPAAITAQRHRDEREQRRVRGVKPCSRCHNEYPATGKYFSSVSVKQNKDGLCSWCRECGRKANREYQKSVKGKIVDKKTGYKYRNTIFGHLRVVYRGMKARCNNPNNSGYIYYGGRGIKCLFTSDEFVDYVTNILQVDPRGLEIHRINPDRHYEIGNIAFLTRAEHMAEHKRIRKLQKVGAVS